VTAQVPRENGIRRLWAAIPPSRNIFLHAALAFWFVAWSTLDQIGHLGNFGGDARLYYEGAAAWLAGRDPWSVSIGGVHFAGLPPTVEMFAPFTLLPVDVVGVLWLGLSVWAAVFTVRRLRLPWYWLFFPPLVQGVVVANPHVVILALLVAGHPALEALAAALKGYALIPVALRLRWRGLLAVAALGLLLFAVAPGLWFSYAREFSTITGQLDHDAIGGFSATWLGAVLVVPALAALGALWFVDRDSAAWLAVPALWPASQYLYASFTMPIRSAALAAALSIPTRGWTPLVIIVYAFAVAIRASLRQARERRRARER
jgi:hypothetical protein